MGTYARRLWVPHAARSGHQIKWCSRNVNGASVKHVFYIKPTKTLNLLWLVTQDSILNVSGKKSSNQFTVQKYFKQKQGSLKKLESKKLQHSKNNLLGCLALTGYIFTKLLFSTLVKKSNQPLVQKNEINISN